MTLELFQDLLNISSKLRSKDGCPWDRKQTLTSLMPLVQDEVDELKQGIENKDYENIKEEIGDVLFSLMLMSEIAAEEKKFTMSDILSDIKDKIISRHTWVFGKDKVNTADEALELWRKNKLKEKNN